MKTFAITYVSEMTSEMETVTLKAETNESVLESFSDGKVVDITEVRVSGKNL